MRLHDQISAGTHTGRRRWGRAQQDPIADPYKFAAKPSEPSVCPRCGAVWQEGRWCWPKSPISGTELQCQACHRIEDHYPAGVVTLTGAFLFKHKEELLALVRHQEEFEKAEHPLNRIMSVEETPDTIVINTTDIHLPRRIGKALKHAYKGALDVYYEEDAYFARVNWRRD